MEKLAGLLAVWSSGGERHRCQCGGSEFDSRAGQIGQNVANGPPPLRRFFGAVLPRLLAAEIDPATRYTRRRDIASIMKI